MKRSDCLMQNDIHWDYLMESLKEEKCVLCLGSGIYSGMEEERLETTLARHLRNEADVLGIRVYDDGWFHYKPKANKIEVWQAIKQFYNQPRPFAEHLLEKIAEIPFSLALNFTPDQKLTAALDAKQYPYDFQAYLRRNSGELLAMPCVARPLIYNFLGVVTDKNSLVMTYDDFYAYLQSQFVGQGLPDVIEESIANAHYILFLGVPFDQWYGHLFMRVLKQHQPDSDSKKYAFDVLMDDRIATSCFDQYTISFVSSDIAWFIDALYSKCKAAGTLREQNPAFRQKGLSFDVLRQHIKNNNFSEAFDRLQRELRALGNSTESFQNQLILLSGQFYLLKKNEQKGIIASEELFRQYNLLRNNFMELLIDLEK